MDKNIGWLYENDKENSNRYVLGTKGENTLVCFGVNPSTAQPNDLDNTLQSVARLAANNGFDSWIMLNLYPQRSTNPNGMHKDLDIHIHEQNIMFINDILSKPHRQTIWAAWGTLIEKRPFLIKCLTDIHQATSGLDCKWVTIGKKSKKGHPHHPLYLNSKTLLEPFDVYSYIENQRA